jgi:hypothetical protein
VKHAPFMPPPLPEPPENINRAIKLIKTTLVSGAHYVFVEIPLSNHLNFLQDCILVLTVCSVSHLVDMFLTSFIEIGMLEEAFSFCKCTYLQDSTICQLLLCFLFVLQN